MYTPPTSAVVAITIEGDLFADLEKWRRRQVNVLPRTFAVRELLARALATERRRVRSAERSCSTAGGKSDDRARSSH